MKEQTLKQESTIVAEKKPRRFVKILGIIVVITLAVALLMMVVGNQISANAIKEKQIAEEYNEWLGENCECLAKERYFCPDRFKLRETICADESRKMVTLRLIGCSKYNCSGEIKTWNNQTERWE